jgi:xylulokinase
MLTLGIDSSTQGVKAVVWDVAAGNVVFSAAVNYGRDLPEFGAGDGFLPSPDVHVRHADPRMWVAGLDLVLARLQASGCPMAEIAAIGGDAQQHATVYLESFEPLVFSRPTSPIWMDSSTARECAELEARFGERLRTDTGSPAIERFAAAQIMKFAREDPAAYARTRRIHLLSSFLSSLLTGEEMPVDTGDGAGMNLLNLRTGAWDADICSFVAPDLLGKLPPVGSLAAARPLAARFARYGLRPGIPVAPFTGDNPATLVGCGAETPGTAVVSLGTSDVFFAAMPSFRTDPDGYGHVFGNPAGGFLSLACFKNGSLARERVRRELGVDWTFFDETAFEAPVPAGAERPRAFPYFETEITPRHAATGIEANFDWVAADAATKVRAVVEGQVANMVARTRWIGTFSRLLVVGGAARSKGLRQTLADLFRAEVTPLDVADAAAVGGARLAARVLDGR